MIFVTLKDKFTCQKSHIFGKTVKVSLWKYTNIKTTHLKVVAVTLTLTLTLTLSEDISVT